MKWYIEVLKKYAVFSGRARRAEYWYFVLFNMIISIVLAGIDYAIGSSGSAETSMDADAVSFSTNMGLLGSIYTVAVLLPSIAVAVRRLHDTDRSGWWMFILLIPLIGAIVLLVFLVQDSKPGNNEYGSNPKGIMT